MADSATTRPSLLLRIRDTRDAAAWSQFVELYAPLVYGFARRHGPQDADADDLTQDVLRSVVRSAWKLEYDPRRGSFRGWLFTIVQYKLRDYENTSSLDVLDANLHIHARMEYRSMPRWITALMLSGAMVLALAVLWGVMSISGGGPKHVNTDYLFLEEIISAELTKISLPKSLTAEQRAERKVSHRRKILGRQLARSLVLRGWKEGPISQLTEAERAACRSVFSSLTAESGADWTAPEPQSELNWRIECVQREDGILTISAIRGKSTEYIHAEP